MKTSPLDKMTPASVQFSSLFFLFFFFSLKRLGILLSLSIGVHLQSITCTERYSVSVHLSVRACSIKSLTCTATCKPSCAWLWLKLLADIKKKLKFLASFIYGFNFAGPIGGRGMFLILISILCIYFIYLLSFVFDFRAGIPYFIFVFFSLKHQTSVVSSTLSRPPHYISFPCRAIASLNMFKGPMKQILDWDE